MNEQNVFVCCASLQSRPTLLYQALYTYWHQPSRSTFQPGHISACSACSVCLKKKKRSTAELQVLWFCSPCLSFQGKHCGGAEPITWVPTNLANASLSKNCFVFFFKKNGIRTFFFFPLKNFIYFLKIVLFLLLVLLLLIKYYEMCTLIGLKTQESPQLGA